MATVTSTKDEELRALTKIRKIVEALGPDSYVSTAFTGCFADAEENIQNDFALSMSGRLEYAEQQLEEAKARIAELKQLETENKRLTALLEKELEWHLYEMRENVKQEDYERLAGYVPNGANYMTDEEAKDWICDEFDFDRDKITILHEIDEYEISRHNQLRKTGRKIDRRPVYCATDYHYIRFNTSHWYYEVWNDTLCPFYC